jgi:hypothetical protein
MITVNDPALYDASLVTLKRFTRGSYYGRLAQMFLACKHYGSLIPHVGASQATDISTLQRLLDELYDKPSRRPGPSVLILFSNNHLYPTGVTGPGLTTPANIWRNNFNFQKGFCCYGSDVEILDSTFRRQSRKLCPHLVTATPNQLDGASCDLDQTRPEYRNEDHPKVFRIDPMTSDPREIFVYDPTDIANYTPLVLAPNGRRLPLAPLLVALYHDSALAAGRTQVDVADFLLDFDFSPAEAVAYFDDNPAISEHVALFTSFPGKLSWTRLTVPGATKSAAPAPLASLPGVPVPKAATSSKKSAIPPILTATPPTAPPAGGHWWDAEQAVRQTLEDDGWYVLDVTRFGVGYDLRATKAGTTRHVEVKSSAGRCTPLLTPNELKEARSLRTTYVLAVVENFDPAKSVSILWVQDPARLPMDARQSTAYSIPRSGWLPKASGIMP